ncbi:hypothetical protein T07_9630 [Trichinella nelsoni]|uniref:Uncharacterized protein n=1 Tax=Trichinella nelsoni TaxID=6336 RepID=A0A0V0RCP3_9BILA|nr:hypothetical protein T07_9630 [Trichinella nelsoni]
MKETTLVCFIRTDVNRTHPYVKIERNFPQLQLPANTRSDFPFVRE